MIYISNLLSSKTVAKEITMKKKETDTCANHFNRVLLNLMFMTVLLQHRKSHHRMSDIVFVQVQLVCTL